MEVWDVEGRRSEDKGWKYGMWKEGEERIRVGRIGCERKEKWEGEVRIKVGRMGCERKEK